MEIFQNENFEVELGEWSGYCNLLYFFKHSEALDPWNWQDDYPEDLALRHLYREEDKNILLGLGRLRSAKLRTEAEKREEDKREAERQKQAAETEAKKRELGIGPYKYQK